MYGKKGHLVTLVDRRSRYFMARRIPLRTKVETARAVISMLKAQPGRTLTLDNGVEFADHKRIEKEASTKIYFADPYASWQRGSNENSNGRLRRWIPRSIDLSAFTSQKIRRIIERMNNQPRKCLGWKTPYEVHHNASVSVIVVSLRFSSYVRPICHFSRQRVRILLRLVGAWTRAENLRIGLGSPPTNSSRTLSAAKFSAC